MGNFTRTLWQKQEGRCFYCLTKLTRSKQMVDGKPLPNMLTVDHVIPRAVTPGHVSGWFWEHGLVNNPNLVLACFQCNHNKGDKIPREWDGRLGPYKFDSQNWHWTGEVVEELNLKMGSVSW